MSPPFDLRGLQDALAAAMSACVVTGSSYDSRRRRNSSVLAIAESPATVSRLGSALGVDPTGMRMGFWLFTEAVSFAMTTEDEGSVEDWPQDADGVSIDPQVWDRQSGPLTVELLRTALDGLSPSMEVTVMIFDGTRRRDMQPVDITIDHRADPPLLTMTASQVDAV